MSDVTDDLGGFGWDDWQESLKIDDDEKIWVTKQGEEIAYKDLGTEHIKNIIKLFEFDEDEMPNLFEELKGREVVK